MVEVDTSAATTQQHLDQIHLQTGCIRVAEHENRPCRQHALGIFVDQFARPADPGGQVGNTQIFELLARARGDPNHRGGALCKCAAACFSDQLDHRVRVRRLEARVQQVGHFPNHGRIPPAETVERLAQARFATRELPDQGWEQRVVGSGRLAGAREDRRHQPVQGLDRDPGDRATVLLDQASGQVLAQASRGHDHAHGYAEQTGVVDALARERTELFEQVRFRRDCAAQHQDTTDRTHPCHRFHRPHRAHRASSRPSKPEIPAPDSRRRTESSLTRVTNGVIRRIGGREAAARPLPKGTYFSKYLKYKVILNFEDLVWKSQKILSK